LLKERLANRSISVYVKGMGLIGSFTGSQVVLRQYALGLLGNRFTRVNDFYGSWGKCLNLLL
jgi:hypothetical protein